MEQTNYPELYKKMFSDHIHDPSAVSAEHLKALESLTIKYPYSQLLRAFYTRSLAETDPSFFEKELMKTALYSPDRDVLRTIIENAESLKSTPADNITLEDTSKEGIQTHDYASFEEQLEPETDKDLEIVEPLDESLAVDEQSDLREDVSAEGEMADQISETIFRPEMETFENLSPVNTVVDQQKISKYNDDKMPYSFLWWLNRTRKEHSESYQPYVSFHLDTSQSIRRNNVDQLSTQIIENIFHLQSPIDQLKDAPRTVPFQVKRKEDYILEKFIREEPQIKAPNSERLDTENKARKSAEDPNDLVSETLAHIYTDQMLFHKAIDTYKKLSLKFPEKSTYFADQIRELEKKIN
ncbi:MAG: hypothetical protein ACYCZO_10645 [Daejeonella sp.]